MPKRKIKGDVRTVVVEPETDRTQKMRHYVKVIGHGPGAYGVRFQIGSQQFYFGNADFKLEEAEWFRDQLCVALDTLIEQVVGKLKRSGG